MDGCIVDRLDSCLFLLSNVDWESLADDIVQHIIGQNVLTGDGDRVTLSVSLLKNQIENDI